MSRLRLSRYLWRRTLASALTFVGISLLVFGLLRVAPGGPFDGERALPPEVEANLRAAYHLDEPLPAQYLRYMGGVFSGDLGPSFTQKDFSVNDLVASGAPISMALGGLAFVLALAMGLSVGVPAGLATGSTLDRSLMAVTNLGLSIPVVITAPVFVLLFAVSLGWLPAGGIGTWRHYVLPAVALALPYAAAIARLARGGVAQCTSEPHLLTARAKGLPRRRIVFRHILPIALFPVLSYLGPLAAALLTGSVVIEQVFDLPGIGRYFVQGALNRDYTLVMGVALVYALFILTFNLLVDLAYFLLDPRTRRAVT